MKPKKLRAILSNILHVGEDFDPFIWIVPNQIIIINLLNKEYKPERNGDDIEKFYNKIIDWFDEQLIKADIDKNEIEKAVIMINADRKEYLANAWNMEFSDFVKYRRKKHA